MRDVVIVGIIGIVRLVVFTPRAHVNRIGIHRERLVLRVTQTLLLSPSSREHIRRVQVTVHSRALTCNACTSSTVDPSRTELGTSSD